MLDYEKLDVYQCAIKFFGLATQILDQMPRGNSSLSDQLKRAALSIPLNIAEGTGKISAPDKKKILCYFTWIGNGMRSNSGCM